MLDGRGISIVAEAAEPLPVEAMVKGKRCEDAAAFLPRVFNLCRAAQSMAAHAALGVPHDLEETALRHEILRDHVLRLTVILPSRFGQISQVLPQGWQKDPDILRTALFGTQGKLPQTPDDFARFMESGAGLSQLFLRLRDMFAVNEAASAPLPYVDASTAMDPNARVENAPALRVKDHPVVTSLAKAIGRGPLWRVVARAYDLEGLLDGAPLTLSSPSPNVASVPATRGLYSLSARSENGRVTSLSRVTPTDHLCADGGVLDQTLARLDPARSSLAPLILDILDPCSQIRLNEVRHA